MKLDHETDFMQDLIGDGKSEWVLVNPRMLLGLVGAVACYAWLFLMMGTSAFVPFVGVLDGAVGGAHFCFAFGIMASLTITWFFSDFFSPRKRIQFSLGFLCTVLGSAGLWFLGGDWLWLMPSAALMGMGFGLIYVLYGEFVCVHFHASIKAYLLGIFCCAFVVCAGLLFAGPQMGFFFGLLFPTVAFAAYACVYAFFRLGRRPIVDKKTSDARNRVVWRSYLATATAGMAAGFAVGCLLSSEPVHSWAYGIVEVLAVATSAFLLVDSCRKNRVNETITMRFFLPFAAVLAFPLMFVPQPFKFVFAVLLLCGSLFPITCSLSAICKHIVLCDLSAVRAFSFGRLICFAGIALGMALAFVGFSRSEVSGYPYEVASAAAVVVFMILVIFSASFVMTEDNYPDEARIKPTGLDDSEGSVAADVGRGVPIRKLETVEAEMAAEQNGEGASGEEHPNRPGIFHIKCEIVARTYGLSNRQREVLGMLAKGRNADYITEKLIISSHTAKAHIYNIYQKTGVHSRQELMDLVENVDVSNAGSLLQDILSDRA
ncbi:LuxR family transcriptional regulator [Gordonibacter sp.]|nr:LuxR family transcriptional regulator [Gordonibacter sp.]